MAEREIINRVAQSPLITIDLKDYYDRGERVIYDLKDNLYEGIILKEKDFRQFLKDNDWSQYQDKHVGIHCSVDAIIPHWAYMLLVVRLEPYARTIVFGDMEILEAELFRKALSSLEPSEYQDRKVVVKGCGDVNIPAFAFTEITRLLKPFASSIMYGEPCSTVPIYKRPVK